MSNTLVCRVGSAGLARACDHDAIFSLLYLRTTETFQSTLFEIGYSDRASIIREDALFAEYYFRAFDACHGPRRDECRSIEASAAAFARVLAAQTAYSGGTTSAARDAYCAARSGPFCSLTERPR